MSRLPPTARRLLQGEGAATTVEYALVISLIAATCFAAIAAMTSSLAGPFQRVTTALSS